MAGAPRRGQPRRCGLPKSPRGLPIWKPSSPSPHALFTVAAYVAAFAAAAGSVPSERPLIAGLFQTVARAGTGVPTRGFEKNRTGCGAEVEGEGEVCRTQCSLSPTARLGSRTPVVRTSSFFGFASRLPGSCRWPSFRGGREHPRTEPKATTLPFSKIYSAVARWRQRRRRALPSPTADRSARRW